MANKDTISQKIELTGEAQYNATLKSVNRNLKTLKSELKAETKELGNNATAEQKAEVQAKNLKKQIAEQEKAVQACRDALEEVREKYGNNEQAVAAYEVKLNNARASLADMKNQLDSVSGSMDETSTSMEGVKTAANTGVTAAESFATALEKVSSVGETVSGAIESIFGGIVSTVQNTVVELWSTIAETSAKANNWTDVAAIWGTNAQTIQQWSGAMQAAQKDLGSLQTLVSRIVLGGKTDKITEMLNISDENYTDKWEYATQVIGQLYKKVQAGEDITPISEAIFGEKKSTTLIDLVNNWGTILSKLDEFNGDETGYGLTSEGLETFNEIYVKIGEIEAKWNALKMRFVEGFGDVTLNLQAHVIGGLDALADFLNAETDEEREAALENLQKEVEGFAEDAAAAIEAGIEALSTVGESLKDSDNPYVAAVGNIFDAVANTLQWIVEHQEDVVKALNAIFGIWLLGKIAAIAGKLKSLVAQIEVIRAWQATQTAVNVAGAGAGTAAGAGAGTVFAGLAGAALIAWGAKEAIEERQTNENIRGSEGAMNQTAGENEELTNALQDYVEAEKALQDMFDSGDYSDEKANELLDAVEATKSALDEMEGAQELLQAYSDWRQENSLGNMDWQLPEGWQRTAAPEPESTNPLNGITPEQQDAAETFWDFWKNWDKEDDDAFDEAFDAYEKAFEGNEELFNTLDGMMDKLYQENDSPSDITDLPASWWEGLTSSETLKKSDIDKFSNIPDRITSSMESAIMSGMSGIKVEMDGQVVGTLIAPYINQQLAWSLFK